MALTSDYVMPRLDALPYLDKPTVYFAAGRGAGAPQQDRVERPRLGRHRLRRDDERAGGHRAAAAGGHSLRDLAQARELDLVDQGADRVRDRGGAVGVGDLARGAGFSA